MTIDQLNERLIALAEELYDDPAPEPKVRAVRGILSSVIGTVMNDNINGLAAVVLKWTENELKRMTAHRRN